MTGRLPSEELLFQTSNEARRQTALEAVDDIDGDSVFAFPVRRFSTGETLLLVVKADDAHQGLAIAAVLSIDPDARHANAA